jgi:hypothetical protein
MVSKNPVIAGGYRRSVRLWPVRPRRELVAGTLIVGLAVVARMDHSPKRL